MKNKPLNLPKSADSPARQKEKQTTYKTTGGAHFPGPPHRRWLLSQPPRACPGQRYPSIYTGIFAGP